MLLSFSQPWEILKFGKNSAEWFWLGLWFHSESNWSCNRWRTAIHFSLFMKSQSFSMWSLHTGQFALPHSMSASGKLNCLHSSSGFTKSVWGCKTETTSPFMISLRSHRLSLLCSQKSTQVEDKEIQTDFSKFLCKTKIWDGRCCGRLWKMQSATYV